MPGLTIDMDTPIPLHWNHSTWEETELSIEKLWSPGLPARTLGHTGVEKSGTPGGIRSRVAWAVALVFLLLSGCDDPGERPLGPDPRLPELSREEATSLLTNGDFDGAVDALRPYATMEPADSQAIFDYAQALMGAHRQSLAVWPLQRLMTRPDAPPGTPRLFITALLFGGADAEAVAEATRLLEANPEAPFIRFLRVQAYEKVLDLESAVEDMEILVDESPGEARQVERLLNLLIKIEDWDSARERIEELRGLLGRDGVAPQARAIFCATSARFEKERGNQEIAEKQLRDCLEEYPFDPNIVFSLSELLDETDRVAEATELLEDMVAKAPRRQAFHRGLASRYTRLDRYDDADALLLKLAEEIEQPAAWLTLADLRVLRGELTRAVEAVDRAVEIAMGTGSDDPAIEWSRLTPESRFGLGDVYIRAEKLETADRIIESLDDEPGFALLLRGRAKLERGDPAGALVDYQEAFRAFPSNPAARYLAGRAALEVGDFDLAITLYQDALRSDSAATDAGIVLGRMLLAEGRPNYAIDTLTFFLVGNDGEPHALRVLAQAGFATGNHVWAETVRARLANSVDWAGIALADQAKDLSLLNGVEAARDYLAKSPSLEEPTHFEALSAWVGYSNALGAGAGAEARERVRELLALNPEAAGFLIVWSRILYEDGESADAIEAIRRAIELNPMLVTAPGELGMMLLAEGKVDEAIASFDRATEIDPLDARAALSAAEGLLEAGREDEAEERLRKILIHHPWHGRAALLLVDLMRERGPIDERTYQIARRAARMIGLSGPRAHYELARIESERGSYEEALEAYGAALRANYDPPQVEFEMAGILVALDRGVEALPLLEHALASENFQESVAALALLEELRGEEQKQ